MGGNTGNIRTLRNQSGTNGSRTLGSILASDSGAGAGSIRRIFSWQRKTNPDINAITAIFGINRGQFKTRSQWSIGAIYR
jgi:hypothetical protein